MPRRALPPASRVPPATRGAAAGDIYISIENLRGTDGGDYLTGDGNNNVLEGGLGNDTLDGGANGLDYGDTVSYAHAASGVTVSLAAVGAQNTIGAGTDTLTNFERLLGSSFADDLTGNGNSVLEGGAGDDHLTGVSGQSDTASYAHATAGVLVDLDLDGISQDTNGAGSDTLTNIANLQGSQFNDILTGNSADNILFGNGGNDTFVFNQTLGGIGHDTIGDFTSGQDHIALDYEAFHAGDSNDFSQWLQNHADGVRRRRADRPQSGRHPSEPGYDSAEERRAGQPARQRLHPSCRRRLALTAGGWRSAGYLQHPRNPHPLDLGQHRGEVLMAGAEMVLALGQRNGVNPR